jgi:FKBP-type peptidyl-prolyl cis-trans isomerase FkpA
MIKKYSQTILMLLAAGLILSLVSCDPSRKYEKQEKDSINNYLSDNFNKDFELKPSGLYYLEEVAGTGEAPAAGDTVYVQYTGSFLDGTVFDTNVGKADFSFPLGVGYAIYGFDEGIGYMKTGGKSLFLIPSKLGYGASGNYYISGYTPLLFEVTLTGVHKGAGK